MRRVLAVVAAGAMAASAVAGQVLYNNGPFITHPGRGAGGADVSMASVNPNSAGSNMFRQGTNQYFRIADNFTIPAGEQWQINMIRMFGYSTNAPPGQPGWTGFSFEIDDQTPGDPTPVYQTTNAPTIAWTNVYRVFNGVGNLGNTQRAVNSLDFAINPPLNLGPGTYWVNLQVAGGTSGWANYVMDPNPQNPDDPITRPGDARQLITTGWGPAVAGSPAVNVEFPFIVEGVPEPASLMLLGLGAALLGRRRRIVRVRRAVQSTTDDPPPRVHGAGRLSFSP